MKGKTPQSAARPISKPHFITQEESLPRSARKSANNSGFMDIERQKFSAESSFSVLRRTDMGDIYR